MTELFLAVFVIRMGWGLGNLTCFVIRSAVSDGATALQKRMRAYSTTIRVPREEKV